MFRYRVGSHVVASRFSVPGLLSSDRRQSLVPTIIIDRCDGRIEKSAWCLVRDEMLGSSGSRIRLWRGAGSLRLLFEYLGYAADFGITDQGRRISMTLRGEVPETHWANLLTGPVLGRALRIQHHPCFHATFCALGDRAVGLMAPSGAGKSTLALALARAGCDVVTDDLAVIEDNEDGVIVHPGVARLKLWADGTRSTEMGAATPMFPGVAGVDKVSVDMGEPRRSPVRVHAMYQLSPRHDPSAFEIRISALSPAAAMAALAANVYGTLAGDDPALRRAELRRASEITSRTRIRQVSLPDRIEYLTDRCDEVVHRLFA